MDKVEVAPSLAFEILRDIAQEVEKMRGQFEVTPSPLLAKRIKKKQNLHLRLFLEIVTLTGSNKALETRWKPILEQHTEYMTRSWRKSPSSGEV